jgi:hypothetical protein
VEANVCQVEKEVAARDCERVMVAEVMMCEMELQAKKDRMTVVLTWYLVPVIAEHDIYILSHLRYVNY